MQLTPQRGLDVLIYLELPTRKLPQPSLVHAGRTFADQHLTPGIDKRRYGHVNTVPRVVHPVTLAGGRQDKRQKIRESCVQNLL
jgi:hypothetical protein